MNRTTILSVASVLLLGACAASAGLVNGVVDGINTLTSETYFTDVSGEVNANLGATDAKIASGIINNNSTDGWKLTVTSANNGNLVKTGLARKILYTSIKLVKTGGTLGAGLTDPAGTYRSVVSGAYEFSTVTKAATTATVDYAFELQITWSADNALVAGIYEDTVTMTLAVDA